MKGQLALLGALMLACGTVATVHAADPAPQIVSTNAGTVIVKGTVVDENGEPVVGASVVEPGTTRGTSTDINGNFSLKVSSNANVQVSFIGYKTVTRKASDNLKIKLANDNALLDEVVVVGYGQQKKVNLTGAVTNVDLDKTLTSRPEKDVTKALQGAVPGLTILNSSGDINSEPTIQIRGVGSLNGTGAPLIVVDGVPVEDLAMINGEDIASVTVLKDAASTSIYGTRAAFGVILITTKQGKKGDRVTVNYSNNFAWDQATYLPDYPDVPTQLKAALESKARAGSGSVELFGMYFDKLLPYAEAWQKQYGGKKGYGPMTAYQSMDAVGDYYFNGNQPMYYADYDIQDIWYSNHAPSNSHDVSISGSSGRTTFYAAFGYNSRQDLMKFNPAKLKRYNATLNLQTDLTDWLTVGARVNFTRRHFSRSDSYSNIYQYLWRWGSFFVPSGTIDGLDTRFVAMQKQAARQMVTRDNTRLNGWLRANITKNLTLNADFTYTIKNMNSHSSDFTVYGYNWSGVTPQWIVGQSNTNTWRDNSTRDDWSANAYLTYQKSWNDAHNLKVMAGINGENMSMDYFYALRPQLYNQDYEDLGLTYGPRTKWGISSDTNDRSSAGYFGRINYDYKGIYLLELNGRYDGSSRFPSGDKWAFFPSFSMGWRFSQEAFWESLRDKVSNGKLRFSYGEIGNEDVGSSWPYISTIDVIDESYVHWLDASGAKVNEFEMPLWVSSSLTWERIKTIDVGLDLGILNDMVTLGFDWYQRTTNDMLAQGSALPPSVGADAPLDNSGKLRTRGWELNLSWRKQFNKDLGAYVTFNIADSKSKITEWKNDKNIGHPLSTKYAYKGETWGDIWGFETDRYFTESDFKGKDAKGRWIYADGVADQTGLQNDQFVYGPGDIKFKDLDGSGVIDGGKGTADDHGDLKVIGNCLPRYEYSFHIGGNYRGFDLDLFFQGVGKRSQWTTSAFMSPEMRVSDLAIYAHQTSYNRYLPEEGIVEISESNDFPVLYPGNDGKGSVPALASEGGCHNFYPQSKYLIDMSYLRLKNVTLGYTLPAMLTKKAFIQKLRVYASVNNLCLLHKGSGDLPIDPEINTGQGAAYGGWGRTYPITRSWSFGLQVTF